MKNYQVVFAPEAEEQLLTLYRYIAKVASALTAQTYTEEIISYCESLSLFPERGNLRDDLLPGLRVTNWRKRTVIAFVVEDNQVNILGIWHGGQQYETEFTGE
ncbi:type II toxin-antitoxin system RelE/ParE family toxin [Rosenbergiella australiborealis]|uniref:type II toxin-antitoxin system RelE/ParE family toxin n=1 Tax=Rosenbergiella australiborealis TaxID=1544696 RepID=UPI001F4DB3E1|nr:type II toxin-antitoxin system RelE/ParE family toxin [Rosenbergiella australiborealis]